tara:strand:+ start:2829 stop:3521 length:693 start_codon:yes stop_codon:yes gene_type:complete
MSSVDYEIKVMAKSPFVKTLALAVIRNILSHKISYDEKQVINTELVPRFSKKVALATLREGKTNKELAMSIPIVPQVPQVPQVAQTFQKPISRQLRQTPRQQRPPVTQGKMPIQIAPPIIAGPRSVVGDYGKITLLLNDHSVSSIECPGPDEPLTVIRAGQRQFTKITLNQKELRDLFEEIAEKAKIPLMDGVFRAAVENFSISGVISEMIGSRFVIKKQTPYAMLEGGW